jgi:hypothetical protein
MEKWGKIAAVFFVVLFLVGLLVAGCGGRHPNGNPIFVASYSTLLADDGWALSANGQSLVMPPRVFYRDNGDGIVLFLTGPAKGGSTAVDSRTNGATTAPGLAPNGNGGGPYYALWACYYNMRDRLLYPPVEIRGENADFTDMPSLSGAVVMFYGGAIYNSALYPKGFSPGDGIILYSQRDIDTDTENTAGDEKGPNRRLYYCRFTHANRAHRDLGYGFGHGTNARAVDGEDGVCKSTYQAKLYFPSPSPPPPPDLAENVLTYGVVTDGLVGGAAFWKLLGVTMPEMGMEAAAASGTNTVVRAQSTEEEILLNHHNDYAQVDFSDYFAAVWIQVTDVSDVTTVWVPDLKLYRSRFDLSTGTFEPPAEILPDAAAQETGSGRPESSWILNGEILAAGPMMPIAILWNATLYCNDRSVFFEVTDIDADRLLLPEPLYPRDEALNWNRLAGTFEGPTAASPGAMSDDFGGGAGYTSLLISPPRNPNGEIVEGIRINNMYGGDDGLARQYIFYLYDDNVSPVGPNGPTTRSLLVSQVDPESGTFGFAPTTDLTEIDVNSPYENHVYPSDFDTRLSRKGDYIAAAFLQDPYHFGGGTNSLFVREVPTAPSVLTPLPATRINDATGDPVNGFEFQRELRHDWTARDMGIQSENGYMHLLYEHSQPSDVTGVLYVARYSSITGSGVTPISAVERAEVTRSNTSTTEGFAPAAIPPFAARYVLGDAFALDDDGGGVIVYWRGNSTFGTGKDAEYRAFAARYTGGYSSSGLVPITLSSSAAGAANGRQVEDLWAFTLKTNGQDGGFHVISILEDREERNHPSRTTTRAWRMRWLSKWRPFNTEAFYPLAAAGSNTPDEPVLVDTGIDSDVKYSTTEYFPLGPAAFPELGPSAYAGTYGHSVAVGYLFGVYFEHSGHLYYREINIPTGRMYGPYWLDDLNPTNIDGYWVFGGRTALSSRYPMLAGALAFYAKKDPVTQDLRLFARIRNLWFE